MSDLKEDFRDWREYKKKAAKKAVECAGCGCKAWPNEKCLRCGEEN